MKKTLILILFYIFYNGTFAQNKNAIDSLYRELKGHEKDSIGAFILIQLSYNFWGYNSLKAIDFAKQGLEISKKIGYKKGIADAYNSIGTIKAMAGDYISSREYFKKALKIFETIDDKKGIANSWINIGNIFFFQGIYPEALKCQLEALRANEAAGNKVGIASCYNNIGGIYGKLGNYSESLRNFEAFLTILQELGDEQGISFAYNNLGETYQLIGNEEEALKNHMASIKIKEKIDDKQGLAVSYNNMAGAYLRQGNESEALKLYLDALKIEEEFEDIDGIVISSHGIADILVNQRKFTDALKYLNRSLELSKKLKSFEHIQRNYNSLALLDSAQGNYAKAWENYKLSVAYRDSIFNEENSKKLVQTQMQYDFDKKESITKAQNEKELQKQKIVRNAFIAGTLLFLLLATAIFIGWRKTRIEKKKSEELLLNILPLEVANELKQTGESKAKSFTMVTVMFTDFKGFTNISELVSAELLVDEIHYCFSAFDKIIQKYKIEKIKTIGDAYLCASGLPISNYSHAEDMTRAAIEIRDFIASRKIEKIAIGEIPFEIRIGLHTGPVVAGIVGIKKYAYDIWGDTVNLAARMEQNSEAGKVNISGTTYELVKDKFNCVYRGKVLAKGKGGIDMFFVENNKV